MELMRVGISACLLGQEVRYDGGHKRDSLLMDVLGPRVEWVPVCPEVEMGLGTPREPLRLVRDGTTTRMITIQTSIDHTAAMHAWAARRLDALAKQDLDGYVLKSASPSCGLEGVKVYAEGMPTDRGRGLFAAALIERFPLMPVEEETRLRDRKLCEAFIERIFTYHTEKTLRARSHV
jgi:uncharacterized protein YbbK (DUF523 family)